MAGHSVITAVGFGLTGDDERLQTSAAAVSSYEIFDAAGAPVPGGVGDLRMGTTDHNFLCLTCVHGKKACQGHPGHLVLRAGVTLAIGGAEVRRWLRVMCLRCGAVVVPREKYAALPREQRLVGAAAYSTDGLRCPACAAVHPKIVKDEEDHFTFWADRPGPPKPAAGAAPGAAAAPGPKHDGVRLWPDALRAIFERLADADCVALGRSLDVHPRKLVVRVMEFPPNTIRPGVKNYGGSGTSYNDSTSLLQNLVKRNDLLPAQLPDAMGPLGPAGPVEQKLANAVQNLQQIYYDLVVGSSATSATQGSGGRRGLVIGSRPAPSFLRNLPRKEGRIRANLLGGRVLYISRSTISGNMAFRIDEVGVPLEFARTLQVEETVQEYNRDFLMPFFLNGRRQYPGCTTLVRRATGEAHDVACLRDFRLEVGDTLYRDVIDGDLAFFNRQPSLERSNIGVHKVIVIQDPSVHTFQMNVLACEGYNESRYKQVAALQVVVQPAGVNSVSTTRRRVGYNHLVAKCKNELLRTCGETAKLREVPEVTSTKRM